MLRVISLPAINREVTIRQYVSAVNLAKANREREFKYGLNCWWPCTGNEIMNQFYIMVQDHCNRGLTIQKSRYDKWLHSFHHAKKHGRKCKNCGRTFIPERASQFCCDDLCNRSYNL